MIYLKNRLESSIKAFMNMDHLSKSALPEEFQKDAKWQILNKIMRGIGSWNLHRGDYLEFGVYRGLSFLHAYELA